MRALRSPLAPWVIVAVLAAAAVAAIVAIGPPSNTYRLERALARVPPSPRVLVVGNSLAGAALPDDVVLWDDGLDAGRVAEHLDAILALRPGLLIVQSDLLLDRWVRPDPNALRAWRVVGATWLQGFLRRRWMPLVGAPAPSPAARERQRQRVEEMWGSMKQDPKVGDALLSRIRAANIPLAVLEIPMSATVQRARPGMTETRRAAARALLVPGEPYLQGPQLDDPHYHDLRHLGPTGKALFTAWFEEQRTHGFTTPPPARAASGATTPAPSAAGATSRPPAPNGTPTPPPAPGGTPPGPPPNATPTAPPGAGAGGR